MPGGHTKGGAGVMGKRGRARGTGGERVVRGGTGLSLSHSLTLSLSHSHSQTLTLAHPLTKRIFWKLSWRKLPRSSTSCGGGAEAERSREGQ